MNGYYHLFFSRLKIFSLLVILFSLFACGTSDFFFIPLPNDLIFYARYSVYTALLRLPLLFFSLFSLSSLIENIYLLCLYAFCQLFCSLCRRTWCRSAMNFKYYRREFAAHTQRIVWIAENLFAVGFSIFFVSVLCISFHSPPAQLKQHISCIILHIEI